MTDHDMVLQWPVETVLSQRFPLYTRANVIEVFPDPVGGLTMSLYLFDVAGGGHGYMEMGFRDAHVRLGSFELAEFPDHEAVFLGVAGGYAYLNGSIFRVFGERAPGLSAEAMDDLWFGSQPGIRPYVAQPGDRRPDLTARMAETFDWCLTVDQLPELSIAEERVARLRATRPDLGTLTDGELVDRMSALMAEHMRPLFANHVFFSLGASRPVGAIQQITAELGRSDLALTLFGGLGDVDSAQPSEFLWRLSRQIAGSAELMTAFDAGGPGLMRRLASGGEDTSRFASAFTQFLYEHGSRGLNEWDMRSPTWETTPELALAALDRIRLAGDDADPVLLGATTVSKRRAAAAVIDDLLAGRPEARLQFEMALRACRVMIQARERCKTTVVRMIHEARMCMYELGRRMVVAGHFDHVNDFGALTDDELADFLADPSAWKETLHARTRLFDDFAALHEPFLFDGRPPPPDRWERRDGHHVAPLGVGGRLSGMPACPGEATGRARVVLDPFDPARLAPGDVLVAPSVDASWTPLFVMASAVVVDVGATMSHAVIVCRELGIPCVVSVTDATRKVPDGAFVSVDGLGGTVTILSSG